MARGELHKLRREAKDISVVVAERNRYREETHKLKRQIEQLRSSPSAKQKLKAKSDEINMLRQEVQRLQDELQLAQGGSDASVGTLKRADELRHLMDELSYRESHLILLKKEVESLRSGEADLSFNSASAGSSFEYQSPSARRPLPLTKSVMSDVSLLDAEMLNATYVGRDVTNTSPQFVFRGYGSPIDVDTFNEKNELLELHASIRQGDRRIFDTILHRTSEACLLINQGDQYGRTALHLAALALRSDMVEVLLSKGAVVNAQDDDGETPLHLAESFTITELLLSQGRANPNIPNIDGICAIHLAVQRRDINSLRILILHGASVNSADNIRWFTCCHLVALPARNIWDEKPAEGLRVRIVQLLASAMGPDKADLDFQDSEGNSPLHYAAQMDNEEANSVVRSFLDKGANPNIRNERAQSPLHLLCHNDGLRQLKPQYNDTLQVMIYHGADPNAQSMTGCTALHLSLFHKDIDSAVQLVRNGADINLCWKRVRWSSFLCFMF